MPENTSLAEPKIVYFGSGSPPPISVFKFTDALANLMAREKSLLPKGTSVDENRLFSDILGKSLHPKKGTILSPDQKTVASVLGVYEEFFGDIAYIHDLETGINPETIVESAQINQRLAFDILSLNQGKCDIQLQESANTLLQVVSLLHGEKGSLGRDCIVRLRGAQAQAAVMNTLGNSGYEALTPDPENAKEIELWDVRGGTDVVAIFIDEKGDYFFHFIDVKGKRDEFIRVVVNDITLETPYRQKTIPRMHETMIRNLRERKMSEEMEAFFGKNGRVMTSTEKADLVRKLDNAHVLWETAYIPTNEDELSIFGTLKNTASKKKLLDDLRQDRENLKNNI
jgi:hypothetical protein